ncbi:MAG: hypothetical protein QOF40_310 [Actinomycetota bacterium]|nr:hypothetical protein [Actinomycetota bacterium]
MAAPKERTVTLTRRGWSLTGAALGLVVGSFLLGALEMLIVGIAALALLGAVVLWLRWREPPELAISRRVRPDRLHVGSEGRIDLLVENLSPGASPLLAATDWFDEGRRAARFLVPPLAGGATARAAYRIPTRRRGRYRVGPLSVAVSDPFGLARRATSGAGEAELVVRPRVHEIVAPVAVGSRVTAESEAPAARSMVSDLGNDFLTLRDYELGDDLRRVHWRSTARTGELMIRQDEARWRSRAAVVLDVLPAAHDAESFEVAVEAAASVTARLVRLRRRVEVVTSAGTVLGTGGDPRHDVIDRLATVGPDERDQLPTVLENLRAHRRVDLVVAILGRVTPDTLRALGALTGIGVVVVLTRPAVVAPSTSVLVVDASATPFATAWNQSLTRSSAGRTLPSAWLDAHASSHR